MEQAHEYNRTNLVIVVWSRKFFHGSPKLFADRWNKNRFKIFKIGFDFLLSFMSALNPDHVADVSVFWLAPDKTNIGRCGLSLIMKSTFKQWFKRNNIIACALGTGIGMIALCGCAQFRAMDQPKPFKPTATAVGAKRVNVSGELGAPLNSEEANGKLVDTYKYVDGGSKNNGGSKVVRIILYTAGDLFTLFLDQVITWPAEIYGFAGTAHIVTVEYEKGPDGFWHAVSVSDVEQAGKKENEKVEKAESPKAKSDSTPDKPMTPESKSEATSTNITADLPKT